MNTSTKKNKIARAATLLLLVLLSAANALAQTRWSGAGTEQNPYRINSIEELETLAQQVNSGTSYEGQFFLLDADLTYDTATQNNHTAIGTGGKPFKGTFDGNNHTISGIRINNNNYDQGLFGRCENSTVKNLMLTDAKITGSDFVGGIASRNFGSSIEDCQVANNVTVSGEEYVDGIAGINAGSIKNCQVANNVTVSGEDYIGGIAGSNPGSIKDCQVVNNVTVSGEDYIGGIVGWSYGGSSVENCLVSNNVTVSGEDYIGGIVGNIDNSSIKDCQVSNYVTVSGSDDWVGGIVGWSYSDGSIENCHVANNVTISGSGLIGGIAGLSSNSSSIEDCQVAINITINGSTIVGGSYIPNLRRNYYLGCTVGATDVGTFEGDITENNGAVPGYLLTLGEHITSDAVSFTIPAYDEMPETTYHVAPSGDTITLGYELAGCEVTYYVNGEAIAGNTFIMPAEDVSVMAVWTDYTIYTAADWELFCDALQDNATYNRFIGDTVQLAADITVTRMAGSSSHDFMGTFDGQGHTLTVAYGSAENPITEEYAAPFRNLENGAVIRNLHVDGHIYTSNKFASGLAGCLWGTVTISDCRSSVIIHSSKQGDGTHGGIVAVHHNTLTVNGCVFDGRLLTTNGTTLCGGLIGYHYGTLTLSDCLYAPATDVTLAEGETYITNGATFCRNYSGTPANCYYTETLGAAQGKLAHSITSGEGVLMERAGEATGYDISGITSYGTGIMYDSVLYAGNGDEVSLNLTIPEGFSVVAATYTPEGGTATELTPVNGVYSFTMPNADVVIEVVTEYIIHNATEWGNFCDALQDNDTYNRFIGKTVRLANDITVTRMAGSSYHDFMGTFDGQGHTLTLAYGSAESPISEEYAAPFRNVENGCVIENLHVDGTITTASKYAAGIVAQQYGTVTIRNCRSSVTIQSSVEGDGTHGGLVGVKGNSNDANLTIEGCTFDGKIVSTGSTATTNCGGFVGWRSNSGSLTITNSLYAPTADDNAVSSGATFARNWTMPDDANCYYTEALGAAQGKLALTNLAVLPVGEPTATYDVSGLTLYGNGVQFGEVFYYDTERNFLRTIAGYGTGDDGWNLVASPVANGITPTAANGFLTEAYDLFRFNQAADLEWENWKDTVYDNYHYDLASGRGYLYASQTETTLVFSGTPYSGTGEVTLTKTDGIEFSGWNLVGNPFATAKTIGSKPFYRMNDLGTEIIAAETDTIAAMEGIFVVATTDGETVTFAEPTRGGESEERIIINLCDNAAVIDRAIVRLGEGEMLPKLQIRKGNTKVYIPQGGEEYAIVCAGRDAMHCVPTEIPVNFKAKEDGTYTISINPEVVEMGYLHLIDNLIGADVDLLTPLAFGHPLSEGATPPNPLSEGEAQSDAEIGEATAAGRFPLCKGGQGDSNPTYTFTAKTTDYESRFKLVFNANAEDGSSTGSASDEAFAFISNGQLILTSEGSLQVFDALGRQLFAKDVTTFNSQLSTLNFPSPGVYVLRLINGNDMKTQKMVIE